MLGKSPFKKIERTETKATEQAPVAEANTPKPERRKALIVGDTVEFEMYEVNQTPTVKTSRGIIRDIMKENVTVDGKPVVTLKIFAPDAEGVMRMWHKTPHEVKRVE